jgi:uncharacterized membrane protein
MAFIESHLRYFIGVAAVGSGLMSGLLFAFSCFVMSALTRLPQQYGMAAMQHINVVIINPLFLAVFLGTAVASAILAVYGVYHWADASAGSVVLGSLLYLLGTIGVTVAFNVPLNNALAQATPDVAATVWPGYVASWLRWNHLRTLMSIGALSAFLVGLYQSAPRR